MDIVTFEGLVDQGQIRLKNGVQLPDQTRVYVIVPDFQLTPLPELRSPRLAHPVVNRLAISPWK